MKDVDPPPGRAAILPEGGLGRVRVSHHVITGIIAFNPPLLSRQALAGASLVLLVLLGCTRPTDRPLEGARPGQGTGESVRVAAATVEAPPVLVPLSSPSAATASPETPPTVVAVVSPTATGRGPIISTIQPQANAVVPAGPVTVASRISALSDIAEVTLTVDGQTLRPSVSGDARNPTYSTTLTLATGPHQARIQLRDDQGRVGGYSWSFRVGGAAAPATSSPAPRR